MRASLHLLAAPIALELNGFCAPDKIVDALDEQTAALPPRRQKSGSDNRTFPGIAVPTVYMSFSPGDYTKTGSQAAAKKYNDTLEHFLKM